MLSPDEDVFRGVSSFLDMLGLAVHRDYCEHGLASRLVKKTLALGEERGYSASEVQISNTLSEKIYNKQGFETIKTLDLATVEDEFGLDISLIPGETILKLMVKRPPSIVLGQ
ncbi:uncharacterized protein LOC121863439 [Homarus americanus]|uniref:uncharacterized protein LOC121863439 n=1 Tax=Homarus americanus TaxID=6706 RepID=UPI001C4450B6|nr:uncharacterized protein LOC121863439 [Homarus americanus]